MFGVKLNGGGVRALLKSSEVRNYLTTKGERALAAAQASAPVATGRYRDSLHLNQGTTDRAAVRVTTDVPYAMAVEAKHGVLARSLRGVSGT
jgi:hypothetical protein